MPKTLSQINDDIAELNDLTAKVNELGNKLNLNEIPKEFADYIKLTNHLYVEKNKIEKSNTERVDYILTAFKKEINILPTELQYILSKYS